MVDELLLLAAFFVDLCDDFFARFDGACARGLVTDFNVPLVAAMFDDTRDECFAR